jgi:hypothetical protein
MSGNYLRLLAPNYLILEAGIENISYFLEYLLVLHLCMPTLLISQGYINIENPHRLTDMCTSRFFFISEDSNNI